MEQLILVAIAGFCASMVDGALGMGFGPTSSTILLSSGLSPTAASTVVNLAKVATGLAAAIANWRFENIDHRLVVRLALPGCVGAVLGVTVLTNVDGDTLRPILAAILLAVGLRILARFSRPLPARVVAAANGTEAPSYRERGTMVAATAGGVTNGLVGAWGPVVTPFLLHRGLAPRYAVGSVNTAEVAVAIVASGSLITSLGTGEIDWWVVVAMLLGGVVAAPLAAWTVKRVPARALGVAVGGLLLLTQSRELAKWAELGHERWAIYAAIIALVGLAAYRPRLSLRFGSPVTA
jgi:uncharacterized protein